MTADERLARIRSKVQRAKQHFGNLKIARDRFIESEPYVVESKKNPKAGYVDFYLANIQAPPDEIGLITGDVIHNLRSALDHLAYQLVLVNSATPTRQTCFPIFDSAQIVTTGTRQVQGMAQTAIDAINAAKPYQSGTDELWWLHKLDIADKHHAPLLTLMRVGEADIEVPGGFWQPGFKWPDFAMPGFGTPLKDGDVFFTCELGVEDYTKVRFDVMLSDPQSIKSFPLVMLLQKILYVVDALIVSFRLELV